MTRESERMESHELRIQGLERDREHLAGLRIDVQRLAAAVDSLAGDLRDVLSANRDSMVDEVELRERLAALEARRSMRARQEAPTLVDNDAPAAPHAPPHAALTWLAATGGPWVAAGVCAALVAVVVTAAQSCGADLRGAVGIAGSVAAPASTH